MYLVSLRKDLIPYITENFYTLNSYYNTHKKKLFRFAKVNYKYANANNYNSMGATDYSALKGLIIQIFRDKQVPMYKKTIHKILYKLYIELPESNKVRDQLPFYWYNYGPFSEVVARELDSLKESGILGEVITSTENTMLCLNRFEDDPTDSDFREASMCLDDITQRTDLSNFKPFIIDIYKNNAPIKFIPQYKLNFLDPLEDIADFPAIHKSKVHSLERELYKSEAYLPSNKLFEEYNNSFSSFVTTSTRVFDHINEEEDIGYLVPHCLYLADLTWKTFTKGIRIIYHHDYYNEKVDKWNRIYNTHTDIYGRYIKNYYNDVLTEITPDRLIIPSKCKEIKRDMGGELILA